MSDLVILQLEWPLLIHGVRTGVVDGVPASSNLWGWGADRCGHAPPGHHCDRCHDATRAATHGFRGGDVWMCTPCARHTYERAFPRPFTDDEVQAMARGAACFAAPVPASLHALYAGPSC